MAASLLAERRIGDGGLFQVVQGNLLEEPVDAIVNAANGMLAHGGGVAGIIARAAGRKLIEESEAIVRERGALPAGSAVVTTAGNLPFKGVIHAIGPRHGEGDEERKLVGALRAAFDLASERRWTSVSFPAVSSGIFAVPLDLCARSYVSAVLGARLPVIRLCLRDAPVIDAVLAELERQRPA